MSETFIILVNYNNHNDTIQCLSAISSAGYSKNVVVVDNNSTVIGVDDIKIQFPDTILIKNHKNIGFGRANNIGIQWALDKTECEYVFILNNDTIINKNTVPALENALKNNHSIGIAASKIVMMEDPDTLWYGGGEIDWKKCSATIPGYLKSSNSEKANTQRIVTFASGCAILIKRHVLKKLGGFDQRFFMYVEDVELCIRIVKNGFNILYVPESIVYHKGQGSQGNKKKFYPLEHPKNPNLSFFSYHLTKNRLLTIKQHASRSEALQFWAFYPVFLIVKCLQYLFYKRIDAIKAIAIGGVEAFFSN
jgi:GT2 family glycosyltransferase